MTNLSIGQVIGDNRYRLTDFVGQGGMGRVFAAERLIFGTMVAIKFMNLELIGSAEAERMFLDEARNCNQLEENNENIVKVIDAARDRSGVYIVMELLTGRDLDKLLANESIPPARAIALMIQMCRGLEPAHDKGIIHRDLKPANVFIERLAGGERAKILDFGLSKHINKPSRTDTGVIKGTPLYMAPEQYQAGALDARTDVWALGVILYQMLTGEAPFMADNVYALGQRVVEAKPRTPRALQADLDPALESIVLRCLSKDPTRRFATAREVREALEDTEQLEKQLAALSQDGRRGDPGPVLRGLEALRGKYPSEPRIHQRILEHHVRQQAHGRAIEAYDQARRSEAVNAEVHYQASLAYQAQRDVENEARSLELALRDGLHPKLATGARSRLRRLRGES